MLSSIALRDKFIWEKAIKRLIVRMSSHESYLNLKEQMVKHKHPAADRNKEPILDALKQYIDTSKEGSLLEVSSGSGQHAVHFAPHFPKIVFQPTEFESSSLNSIKVYRKDSSLKNIKEPHFLDVRTPVDTWINGTLKPNSLDYILNINLIHISEWACTEGLFKGSSYLLKPGGYLFTYGPYAVNGQITPESNVNFDKMLRERDPSWGLRDIEKELKPLAITNGLHLKNQHDLPANNKFLVWEKK
ncbi:methyltransferase-like 26 isoform X2 [Cimex lectularius]|uniref:Methyltransferase-like 26 n=1 Tax=Cimex lectularius TaxID=79782 RepID=A0A8I6TCP7_CIMLE|nr:methyltransferase-like 26 isoform X2 [Cimex lectularius]